MKDVLLLLGGAALTYIGTLIGEKRAKTTEHQRWLRDKRFEVFIEFLTLVNDITLIPRQDLAGQDNPELRSQTYEQLQALAQRGRILTTAISIVGDNGPLEGAAVGVIETAQEALEGGLSRAELDERLAALDDAEHELRMQLRQFSSTP